MGSPASGSPPADSIASSREKKPTKISAHRAPRRPPALSPHPFENLAMSRKLDGLVRKNVLFTGGISEYYLELNKW